MGYAEREDWNASSEVMLSESFLSAVAQKTDDPTPTATLVQQAQQLLREARKKVISPSYINVQELLQAILECAPCENGQRFTACGMICAAEGLGSSGLESLSRGDRLALLARDWLKLVLWPVKSAHRLCASQHSSLSSAGGVGTPRRVRPSARKPDEFTTTIKMREAGRCAITSRRSIPAAAHFIRPPLFPEAESDVFHPTFTWDILRLYASLPDECTRDPEAFLRSPANGILLNPEMRKTFDRFYWYLLPLDAPDTYRYVPLHDDMDEAVPASRTLITLADRSARGLPLPHPRLVGLHAALARVLHRTGAGEFLDRVFERYLGEDRDLAVPVGKFSGEDLELRMALLAIVDEELGV
ncbi:hypothetical protein OBBRIDRAFT_798751 [Obba rivulosa]|uniref:HNH nuclease domain-containing protein n=1 Tax=Obba rivulosa TaxID=1052685 RepID=A0A8E2DFH7_9APHY|nr:hypothetical protein OBBRIDRAFT_798751 [Obba rivulosa]